MRDAASFLPLSPQQFHILLALVDASIRLGGSVSRALAEPAGRRLREMPEHHAQPARRARAGAGDEPARAVP